MNLPPAAEFPFYKDPVKPWPSVEGYRFLPLVYVAGPYSNPDPVENTTRACRLGSDLLETGLVVPVIPHATLVWHMVDPRPVDYWYEYDLAVMAGCHAVYRMEGDSTGADREVSVAQRLGLPVFFQAAGPSEWDALLHWSIDFQARKRRAYAEAAERRG